MLIALHSMTLDLTTGELAVDRPDGSTRVVNLRSVLDEVGEVDAPHAEPRLSLGDGAAHGHEGTMPADVEPVGAPVNPPDTA